jgi:formylglycine-generating enzyme required for sulfatase activity
MIDVVYYHGAWCESSTAKTGPRSYYVDSNAFASTASGTATTDIYNDELPNGLKDMRGNLMQWTKDWQAN